MNLRAPEQKIERFFRTVRDQFLVELTEDRAARITDMAGLDKLFTCRCRKPAPSGLMPARRRRRGHANGDWRAGLVRSGLR